MKSVHYGDWPTPETRIINPNSLLSAASPSPAPGSASNVGSVQVKYGSGASIPGGSVLSVKGVDTSSLTYQRLKQEAEKLLGSPVSRRSFSEFVDISILSGGEEVQPGSTVTVSVQLSRKAAED